MWGIIVTTENQLINKSYYQTVIDQNNSEHPVKVLGDMYMEEMQKERPELSLIRFAQGEVYFLHNDYEAAIYKWQHPLDEKFVPWAQKNIADAHFEMGLLEHAEKFYNEVKTESIELKSEVLLQLFSLYIQQGRTKKAIEVIKNAVQLNPDYTCVTEMAQTYFEDIKDWDNAIELAVNEAIRTKSLSWLTVIEEYVAQGLTVKYQPNYFTEVLVTALEMDKLRFESLIEIMWNSYKQSELYISWLEEVNQLLLHQNVEESYMWKKLPNLFKEAYVELTSGRFLIQDISNLIQTHLTNWLEISSAADTFISSSAILAWNEVFPSSLNATLVSEAEKHFINTKGYPNSREEGIKLYESILEWAKEEELQDDLAAFMDPLLEEYNIEVASPSKIRSVIKAAIEFLIEKRVEVENTIIDKINWDEKLLVSLQEIQNQLSEMETEQAQVIKDSFQSIKNDSIQQMMSQIPELLRNCSELIREDSDFSKLHVELNNEMNKRIVDYMNNTALREFKKAIQEWIQDCEDEFKDCQIKLNEMSENFNNQFGEEKIVLDGELRILDDWQRDMERISRALLKLEKVNILMRNNPVQVLFKGAGKLLGSISKGNDKIYSKYKSYVENKDYSEITKELISPFIQQLELYEESIEWDVNKFFTNANGELDSVSQEVEGDINSLNNSLNRMREKPEIYRDPLTLFELRLRQYELMNTIS